MRAFRLEATDYIPDLLWYNLNKFSLKRFVEIADVRQLIVKKKKKYAYSSPYNIISKPSSIIHI